MHLLLFSEQCTYITIIRTMDLLLFLEQCTCYYFQNNALIIILLLFLEQCTYITIFRTMHLLLFLEQCNNGHNSIFRFRWLLLELLLMMSLFLILDQHSTCFMHPSKYS